MTSLRQMQQTLYSAVMLLNEHKTMVYWLIGGEKCELIERGQALLLGTIMAITVLIIERRGEFV